MAKFCSNCGTELDKNGDFCGKCGKKVNDKQEGTVSSAQNQKSKIAAGVLGILLGCLGVHNFYLGYTGKAVGQLLLTVCSCGVLSVISGIWGLVEGILILTGSIDTDAEGNKLVD